jgi:hypothetical protein
VAPWPRKCRTTAAEEADRALASSEMLTVSPEPEELSESESEVLRLVLALLDRELMVREDAPSFAAWARLV